MKHHNSIIALILTLASCTSAVENTSTQESSTTGDTTASSSSNGGTSETAEGASSTSDEADESSSTGPDGTDDTTGRPTTKGGSDASGTATGDSSTDTGTTAVCGDGILDESEGCDDGNLDPEDACTNDCEPQFYTGDGTPCDELQALPCLAVGAECRTLLGNQGGGAVCYWPEYSESEMDCNDTAGVWTPFDSAYVENTNIFVPEPGVCISSVNNLICEPEDQEICDAASADSCFQYKLLSGGDSDATSLCWWDADETACGDTNGIWTSSDSMFAMNLPNSIPPDSIGSCISQVTNLD